MDMFTSPIHLAGTLAELHRHDLEIEMETERRRGLIEPARRQTIDILADGPAVIRALILRLVPWRGSAPGVDLQTGERKRRSGETSATGCGAAPSSPPPTGSRQAATPC